MTAWLDLHVVLTTVEDGWTQAQLRELPGVLTCAPTEAEARELIIDALREYLASFDPGTPPSAHDVPLRLTIEAA